MSKCKHRDGPTAYLAWHDWAEKKLKTYKCYKCSKCWLYIIWRRKNERANGM